MFTHFEIILIPFTFFKLLSVNFTSCITFFKISSADLLPCWLIKWLVWLVIFITTQTIIIIRVILPIHHKMNESGSCHLNIISLQVPSHMLILSIYQQLLFPYVEVLLNQGWNQVENPQYYCRDQKRLDFFPIIKPTRVGLDRAEEAYSFVQFIPSFAILSIFGIDISRLLVIPKLP